MKRTRVNRINPIATDHRTEDVVRAAKLGRLALFAVLIFALVSPATSVEIDRAVVIQPFVIADDDGNAAAPARIVEPLIDRVYATAGIDFHFLEPRPLAMTAARDGTIGVDKIIKFAQRNQILRSPSHQLNMFFVNVIDGTPGPCGRSEASGSIVFIAMRPEQSDLAEDAFIVAHEAGHSLGLRRVDNDAHVSGDSVQTTNLMGEGSFEQRVGESGLTDGQAESLRKNRQFVRKRIEFLSKQEAQDAIVDDGYAPYFERLRPREIATLTQATVDAETHEKDLENIARQRFREATVPFTEREKEAINWCVRALTTRLRKSYPLMTRQPWKFIKVRDAHCGGFSHTRGSSIIFSQRTVSRFVEARQLNNEVAALQRVGSLLAHEQLHVLQRLFPRRFARLYEHIWGFRPANVTLPKSLTDDRILNPDALTSVWAIPGKLTGIADRQFVGLTVLRAGREVARMGRDFVDLAVEVEEQSDQSYVVAVDDDGAPRSIPLDRLPAYASRFQTKRGLDHPNEIAAYLFERIVQELITGEVQQPVEVAGTPVAQFRQWCLDHLR